MGRKDSYSPSSSMDSSSHPVYISTSSASKTSSKDLSLSTDLRLGLSLLTSSSMHDGSCKEREKLSDWPPIKPLLRRTLTDRQQPTFFVKVYMEGIPIGRKLDLYAHNDYGGVIKALCRMFKTTIFCPEVSQAHSDDILILTYEDQEGDWMMVGDVPWEMFLSTVKRLRITKPGNC